MSEQHPAIATFVIPFYADDHRASDFLDETIQGLFAQTQLNWQAVIIDDGSPQEKARQRLREWERKHPKQIFALYCSQHRRQGHARNLGIKWAHAQSSPIVLFNDADDISHPRRLEIVWQAFRDNPNTALYTPTLSLSTKLEI